MENPHLYDLTLKSLWDDYEKRTWGYNAAQKTLGESDPRLYCWIGSIDVSGYTREKCLNELIAYYVPGDENRILLRLQDWVPQVQLHAREWIFRRFSELPHKAIVANQGLILYLSRKQRLKNDPGLKHINEDLLQRAESMEMKEFMSFNPMFRRYLFILSFASDAGLRPWVLDDPEPFNRTLLLTEVAFSDLTQDELTRLAEDKVPAVRRRVFRSQMEAGITPSREHLLGLVFDRNRSLRELGQFYLNEFYQEDAYDLYQASQGDEFYFIADYGRKEDADEFLKGVRVGSRTTQHNCLRALATSAPARLAELDLASLLAQNGRFRAVILPALLSALTLDEILELRSVIVQSSPMGSISFLVVVKKKSFWTFVDQALELLLLDSTPALQEMLTEALSNKVTLYEPLPSKLRDRLLVKTSRLSAEPNGPKRRIADLSTTLIDSAI